MQNLNVFPKYLPNFPFQCEFSSELGMGSKGKGRKWQYETLFQKILMQSPYTVHGNRRTKLS